jgi:hypothetical protein
MNKSIEQFELIVRTVISGQTKPEIIRDNIAKYAILAGITYDLARDAIIYTVQARIEEKLAQL